MQADTVLQSRITELRKTKSVLRTTSRETKVNSEMSGKKKIRVIKKGQIKRQQKTEPKTNSARETAREMVQTVTNWVNELQQKRRAEATNALKYLADTPRPSEV